MGVEAAELRRELEGGGFGGEAFEGGENVGGGHLRGAGTNEDVIDVVDLEKDAGVADEAGGANFVSMLGEDGAHEGAEIRGTVDDEDAVTGLVVGRGRGGLAQEREGGFLLGGIRLEDRGEHGDVESFGDERWGGGEADIAPAFAQVRGVAHEKAHAHAVEAGDFGDVEDDVLKFANGGFEGGFEGGELVGDDAAAALQDGDVAAEAGFDLERHAIPLS